MMQRTTIQTPRGAFSALEWSSAPTTAPRLHFAHATGMHAAVYARVLAPLADRFRITASDARGHGQTAARTAGPDQPPPPDRIEWEAFAADLLAIIDAVDPQAPWLLAGHSLGGSVSLLAARARPDRVAGIVLVDPPFIPFAMARTARAAGTLPPNAMADQAARRRADFPDRDAARAAWVHRGVFAGWSDADLDAYLADGLTDTGTDTDTGTGTGTPNAVTLACTPAFEAATFRGVSLHLEAALDALTAPFALVAGATGSTVPPTEFARIAAHPACLSAARIPGTTHFVALEAGHAVAAAVDLVAAAIPGDGTAAPRV